MKKLYLVFASFVFLVDPVFAQKPVADFNTSKNLLCKGSCISFSDLSSHSPTAWLWTFDGASPSNSTDKNPVNICYNTAGIYNVKLVVSNSSGADSITKS